MEEELFKSFDLILDDDLDWFNLISKNKNDEKGKKNNRTKRKHKEFVKYLVSVATHPIGLRASVEPFNSPQEHMLAYIMDMFKLNDTKIRKILTINKADKIDQQLVNQVQVTSAQPSSARKRHSWRPELRIRLGAPTFFYSQKEYLNNLFVRVYLFKEETTIRDVDLASQNKELDTDKLDTKSRGILNKIFKRFQLNPSKLIRPVNEMRTLLKFKPIETPEISSGNRLISYKMLQVEANKISSMDDIHINIRRHYCDPRTEYILRFEFWLDTQYRGSTFLTRYRFYVRRLVYNGCLSHCFTRRKSTYMNENQELYGYVNIKMKQLPSYPIKQNYPIFTLHERKVNNCEICLDIRNRKIREEYKNQLEGEKISELTHVLNHLRLYTTSIIYQCLTLGRLDQDSLFKNETYQNIAIDNLFYLPAYGLINQHRLQSNINQFQDQSIRRISFLLLLIKLHQLNASTSAEKLRLQGLMIILISVLQNEYMMAHRLMDDKTLQEIDPFQDIASIRILKIELAVLKRFTQIFLNERLKDWLTRAEMKRYTHDLRHSITLNSLRMFKSSISNLIRCIRIREFSNQLLEDFSNLKIAVDQLLCEIILTNLSANIENIAYSTSKRIGSIANRRIKRPNVEDQVEDDPWSKLLNKINCINHDLRLYWNRDGLDGLVLREQEFVRKLNMFHRLEKRNFRKFIMEKIDNYLK